MSGAGVDWGVRRAAVSERGGGSHEPATEAAVGASPHAGACRACGAASLERALSLGAQPLANALVRPGTPPGDPRYPLELLFCTGCALAQLGESVAPEALFREYAYFSSYSETFKRAAAALVERLCREQGLAPDRLVVEVASNDGFLLERYRERGLRVLGIEPARNVAQAAQARGVPTLAEFFDLDLARRLREEGRLAHVLHAHNVLAHVPDPGAFARALKLLLHDEGLLVIEVPSVRELVARRAFDTIYHEHMSYFSLLSLTRLLEGAGLLAEHVEAIPLHGGSLRVFARHAARARPGRALAEMLREERALGVDELTFFRHFAGRVRALIDELRGLLLDLKRQGRRLAGYGAAAKATVLLDCLALPPGTLEFVVDRSPHKQGLLIPGARVPVRAPQALLDERPDDVLLFAWNLEAEVLEQQAEYRRRGGRFIVPIPDVRVV